MRKHHSQLVANITILELKNEVSWVYVAVCACDMTLRSANKWFTPLSMVLHVCVWITWSQIMSV